MSKVTAAAFEEWHTLLFPEKKRKSGSAPKNPKKLEFLLVKIEGKPEGGGRQLPNTHTRTWVSPFLFS